MVVEYESLVDFILQTPAPIYSAAKLSRHYRTESTREKERGRDLVAVSKVCSNVAVELLSLACATNPEQLLTAVDDREIPFLDFLIETEQKDCVSHPSVQVYLGDVWRGDFKWDDWKYFLLFILCLFCPPFWAFLCLPWKDRFHKVPIIKFICHLISHIYLILLFCLTTVVPWSSPVDDLTPRWYELLLLIWLSGLLLSQLTDPHDRAGLGWIPLIVLFLSLIGIFLHLIANAFYKDSDKDTRIDMIYTRNQFLAIAMMLCFAQLLDFLSFHHLFGPWGVIIRDLMYDLVRFLVILLIFILGFTAHMAAVYRPMYENDKTADKITSPKFSFFVCFELLFFSLFGLTEMQSLEPEGKHHSVTYILAKATFGIYNVITIIVLVNLLIAMMSDTYQRIQRQSDTEWKFGRAKLIRNMKRSTTTPSPLNLITKLISYLRVLYKTKCRCCRADIIDILRTDDQVPESLSMSNNLSYSGNRIDLWHPNGGLGHRDSTTRSLRIENVLDWKLLVKKFVALRGGNTEFVKETTRHFSVKQPAEIFNMDTSAPKHRRPASVLGLGRSAMSSFGSNMSLHRVVNETVRKLDIVSSMKELSDAE